MKSDSWFWMYLIPFMAALCSSSFSAEHNAKGQSRMAFTAAMSRVHAGMPVSRCKKALGLPDDIRRQAKDGLPFEQGVKEVWCYGIDKRTGFPTLGQVIVGLNENILKTLGGNGNPIAANLFRESKLRRLLGTIDQSPSYDDKRYNPRHLILVVNALQPLGKKKALAVIDEYLRVSPRNSQARKGLFLVLRVLFEVPQPPGYMPPMYVGQPSLDAPNNLRLLPRFPILLKGDVPLLLTNEYLLAGEAQAVEEHVDYYRANCRLKRKPLVPTTQVLEILEDVETSRQWFFAEEFRDHARTLIANQLLRTIDSVLDIPADHSGSKISAGSSFDVTWKTINNLYMETKIRWDSTENDYKRSAKQE